MHIIIDYAKYELSHQIIKIPPEIIIIIHNVCKCLMAYNLCTFEANAT